jgi:membrane AbrB-like protein
MPGLSSSVRSRKEVSGISAALVVTVSLAGGAGAWAGYCARIPAGVLVGTIVGVGGMLLAVGAEGTDLPREVGLGLQILVGLMVGARMTRSSLVAGARMIGPAAVVAASMLVTGVAAALTIERLTSVSLETALFAAVPGGMTEMTTVAASVGADGAAVAAVQLVRLLTAIAAANLLLARVAPEASSSARSRSPSRAGRERLEPSFAVAVLAAIAGGVLGIAAGIPGGGIAGSLAGSSIVALRMDVATPARSLNLWVQVIAGVVIGLGVDRAFVAEVGRLGVATLVAVTGQLLLWLGTGYVLTRAFDGDRITALFASGPGGMSEMISSATQAGGDGAVVGFVHLIRLSSIIALVPTVIVPFVTG